MKPPTWTVTPHAIAALVRGGSSMPAPDGPDFDPRGPIGPIAYELFRRLSDRVSAVALNPQPLPPVADMARLLAQSVVSETAWQIRLAGPDAKAASAGAPGGAALRISDFVDWCGTGQLAQKIADLLRKLGPPKGGGDPPPRPDEDGRLLLIIGAELFAARELTADLGAAGEKLMAQGLQQLA